MDENWSVVVPHLIANRSVGPIVRSFVVILIYVMIKKVLFCYFNLIA